MRSPIALTPDQGELTRTGWKLPDKLTFEQWRDSGLLIDKVDQAKQWWLGDWWNAGVSWGKGQDACETIGIPYQTARNAGTVAGAFQLSRRRDNLSFSHHVEVMSINDAAMQDKFLEWCISDENGDPLAKPRSVRDLRDAIRAYLTDQGWTDSERKRKAEVERGGTVLANASKDPETGKPVDHNLIEWAKFENNLVRIDRGSDWGNPFVMPGDGDRDTVCDNYAVYLKLKPSLLSKLGTLRGKVLVCWCCPERCHGEEIISCLP